MKKSLSNFSLKGIATNEKFKRVFVFVFVLVILFSFSVCAFASEFEYGAWDFAHLSIPESSVTRLLYSTFGSVRYLLPSVQSNGYRYGSCGFVYRSFGISDTPSFNTQKFFQFIGNNAMNLLMNYAFNVSGDYMQYSSINSQDEVHVQFSFSCDCEVTSIDILVSYADPGTGGTGGSTIVSSISSFNGQKVSRSGDLYIIDFDFQPVSVINYLTISINCQSLDKDYAKITVDKSLVPYWTRSQSSGGSPISNVYNITQYNGGGSSTDLTYVYEYLDLVTEWLNLIQTTEGDTLQTLLDFWTDMQARLTTVNTQLNLIRSSLSSISGNTSSILTMCAGINDRVQACMNSLGNIEEFNYEMEMLQEDYLPYLYDIYEILQDIEATLEDFEQKFVDWTATQRNTEVVTGTMKTNITSVFNYVKDFFWSVMKIVKSAILAFPIKSYLNDFNGNNIWSGF